MLDEHVGVHLLISPSGPLFKKEIRHKGESEAIDHIPISSNNPCDYQTQALCFENAKAHGLQTPPLGTHFLEADGRL